MKATHSLALCLVAGLALLHCGAAESYYRSESNYGGSSYQSCKQCRKNYVPSPIKAEDGLVSQGSQFFLCEYGYKPAQGSQAKATCQCSGYWTVDINCIKDDYSYGGQQSYGSYNPPKSYNPPTYTPPKEEYKPSYNPPSYTPPKEEYKPSYNPTSYTPNSYSGSYNSGGYNSNYQCGTLAEWAQCGGKSGVCYNGVGPCEDKAWCTKCPSGQTCQRQSEWYWQCVPPSNNYNSNYNNNYNTNSNYRNSYESNSYKGNSYGRR